MTLGPLMIDIAGVKLTDVEKERLQHPLVGGVILFSRNYQSPQQIAELTAEIRNLRQPHLLIAVDHEIQCVLTASQICRVVMEPCRYILCDFFRMKLSYQFSLCIKQECLEKSTHNRILNIYRYLPARGIRKGLNRQTIGLNISGRCLDNWP